MFKLDHYPATGRHGRRLKPERHSLTRTETLLHEFRRNKMLLIVILNQGGPYGNREEIRTSGLDRTSELRCRISTTLNKHGVCA